MWTDNASKIDMLFYKPYAEIVSDIAIETDIDPLTIGIRMVSTISSLGASSMSPARG